MTGVTRLAGRFGGDVGRGSFASGFGGGGYEEEAAVASAAASPVLAGAIPSLFEFRTLVDGPATGAGAVLA